MDDFAGERAACREAVAAGVNRIEIEGGSLEPLVECVTADCLLPATRYVTCEGEEAHPYCWHCAETLIRGGERDRGPVAGGLGDSGVWVDVECEVEKQMRDFQEPDGSYACDPHVIVGIVIAALKAEGLLGEDLDAPAEPIPLPTQLAFTMAAAERDGHAEAAEWIARVYGGMEDPLKVSQEIRGRDVLAEMDSRRHPEPWENEYAEKLARDLDRRESS